ncbi:MAG: FliA/WhiG family RNA polymerase sigma factor [Planctomycetota bacterium]|nr:FliA/WhiG family RNA polymerase sigma factor [Planctomycetota bacterium]
MGIEEGHVRTAEQTEEAESQERSHPNDPVEREGEKSSAEMELRASPSPVFSCLSHGEAGGPATFPSKEEFTVGSEADQHGATWRKKRRSQAETLWKAYFAERSEANRNALVVHYLPLVRATAERIKSKLPGSIEVGDLISAGAMGLIDAIVKFEPTVGVRFETYCLARVRGEILDYIRSMDWVPRQIRTRDHERERIVAELKKRLGRDPTGEEVARAMGMTQEKYAKLLKSLEVRSQVPMEGCAKYNRFEGTWDMMRMEMVEDSSGPDPSHSAFLREFREVAMRGLNAHERYVIEEYYFNHKTMREIGEEMKLSESRVSQIHVQAIRFLRNKFRGVLYEYAGRTEDAEDV